MERGLQVGQNFDLSVWSSHTAEKQQAAAAAATASQAAGGQSPVQPTDHTAAYLTLYFSLGLASIGVTALRSLGIVAGSITASRQLHLQLLTKVLRLPMSFFDAQPTGDWPVAGFAYSLLLHIAAAHCCCTLLLPIAAAHDVLMHHSS